MTERILVADDSSYMRGVIKKILRAKGYDDIVEAGDGEAAVGAYTKERPAMVLLDIVMPVKSGIDALREIRSADPAARVVMVSAVGQEVIMKEAESMGASGFIVKPFNEAQVQSVIEEVLHGGNG
jgi:two-component system chemotaxis response regulator CheY